MAEIIFDPGLLAKLEGTPGPLELCDRSGRILGTFYPQAPAIDYEAIEQARPKLSREEVERRRQGRTYSTEEVVKHLESL
jgi:hypothetical protein